jgi:hypothetical protein
MTATSSPPTPDAGGATAAATSVDGPSPTAAVVAGLAVPGLDLRTARQVVDLRAARRVRFRRAVAGGAAALVVLALGVVLFPRHDPDDVVADGDRTTTTSSTTTTAPPVTAAPTTLAPVTTVAPTTTVKAAPITLPPTTTAPTTTLPPVQPITVTGAVGGGTAGANYVVTVNWTDPTPGAAPNGVKATVVWGGDVVTTPAPSDVPCSPPGTPLVLTGRYAQTGKRLVQVELSRCNGTGDSTEVQIDADVKATPGSYVVLVGGAAGGQSLDAANATAGGAALPKRDPDLSQTDTETGQPVTVLLVPSTYTGPLELRWGSTCQATAPVSSSTPLRPVMLTQACGQAGTGSTVP